MALPVGALLAAGPAAAVAPAVAPVDPVVAEVVRVLEAGLGEPLVLRWLADSGKIPGRPTADDLVALKKAGASDELVAALLDRARAAPPATAPAPVAPAPRPATGALPPAPLAAPLPAAAPTAAPPPSPAPAPPQMLAAVPTVADATTIAVQASLRYIHVPEEGEPWDLVVYLDGRPFDPLPAAPSAASAGTWTSTRSLAPGRHVLAWAQEFHRQDRQGHLEHAARFDPEPLSFEVAAGAAAAIELEYRDRSGLFLRMGGPVTVRVTQNGGELASRNSSGDPADWPQLCEEIETRMEGKKPGFLARQELRGCLRWADLWLGVSDLPGRAVVRPAGR